MNDRGKMIPYLMVAVSALFASAARAGIIEFTSADEWTAAVGETQTITFTEFPVGTLLGEQYADLGLAFSDGNDFIHQADAFDTDMRGVDGNGSITLAFDEPQQWIAVDFPGIIQFELYSDGDLLYQSSVFFDNISNFAGLLSPEGFDVAVLIDPAGEAAIDNLYFGVPGPSGLAVYGVFMALAAGSRRRPCAA